MFSFSLQIDDRHGQRFFQIDDRHEREFHHNVVHVNRSNIVVVGAIGSRLWGKSQCHARWSVTKLLSVGWGSFQDSFLLTGLCVSFTVCRMGLIPGLIPPHQLMRFSLLRV